MARQDNLIILTSEGAEDGAGKGHKIRSYKNVKKLRQFKLKLRKYNPVARKHTVYNETKK